MLARDFCFWLQGAVELGGISAPLTDAQKDMIVRHLSLVVLSRRSVDELPRADALVFKLKTLHESGVDYGSEPVWHTLMSQLHNVFEHQLDHEVTYAQGHSHGAVMRC